MFLLHPEALKAHGSTEDKIPKDKGTLPQNRTIQAELFHQTILMHSIQWHAWENNTAISQD